MNFRKAFIDQGLKLEAEALKAERQKIVNAIQNAQYGFWYLTRKSKHGKILSVEKINRTKKRKRK
jgi:hypothetical protein